jgi:predicted thioesterase
MSASFDPDVRPAALAVGTRHRARYDVRPDMSPPHLPVHVLSTPWMLGLIEQTCHQACDALLPAGRTLVGTGVTLRHSAPAPAGSVVEVGIEILTVGRRMTFAATVTRIAVDGTEGPIGTATMEMAVVDTSRFGR